MPFDPNSPFDLTDPAQWWRLHSLPHILVQPNPPPSAPSGNPAGDDGPDDWFVPEEDGFPNDWIYPDNNNAPAPAPAPSTAPPAASPQPNPAVANRAPERLDPYHAFWSQMPASRAGAMAWHPPIFLSPDPSTWLPPSTTFPSPFGQLPPAANGLPPDFGPGGILGGIGRIIAEQARANDPRHALANGILGDIPKITAASTSSDPMSLAAPRLMFGSLANLQPAASNAQAAASSLPMSQRFLPPNPIGIQGTRNLYGYVRNDALNRGDTTGSAAGQPALQTTPPITTPFPAASGFGPSDSNGAGDRPETLGSQYYRYGQAEGVPTQISPDVIRPPIRLVNDIKSTAEEKSGAPLPDHDHLKSDPSLVLNPFGESNSVAGGVGWGAGTPGTALVPYRAGPPPAPALQASQPPPRASLPPPSSPSPDAPSPPSIAQAAAASPRLQGTLAGAAPSIAPAQQSTSTTRDGLLRHLDDAQARLKQAGLTAAQKASLKNRPWLEPMHRGERIDTFVKETVAKDASLDHLKITPRFRFGPDFCDPVNNVWYDVTTIGEWKAHEGRYTLGFGRGIPLLYGGDK
jgi:hypothetical protein